MITENDVLELLTLADELSIEVRIDGGRGVDARISALPFLKNTSI